MIALQITSMKNFMNHLLVADTFDPFLLEEATVSTALTVTIDGHINQGLLSRGRTGGRLHPLGSAILEQNKRTVLRPDQGKTHSFVF